MALPQATDWIDALVEAGDPPHGTQSIRRAFLILRVLSSAGDSGLGLSEIAMATGLARPTAHRFLSALIAEGAVEQRPRTQRYAVAKTLEISALIHAARVSPPRTSRDAPDQLRSPLEPAKSL
jgi:DNA-binding IclR family transcriptional regulator